MDRVTFIFLSVSKSYQASFYSALVDTHSNAAYNMMRIKGGLHDPTDSYDH